MIIEEKTIESKTVFAGRVFDVHSDMIKDADGEIRGRDVVIHSGGVTIVAEHNGKIVFVRQYRYGSQETMIELPAGKLDHENEDILSAAKRELEEETGYNAKDWKYLGYIFSNPAICTEKIHLFFAKNLTAGKPHPDKGEFVEYLEIDKNKVFEMVKTGEICDAKTICTLMRAYKL
ncbi:MAG: NUDIX domain-containing protein [Candidatus Gastranaerophilaceae bacterium]